MDKEKLAVGQLKMGENEKSPMIRGGRKTRPCVEDCGGEGAENLNISCIEK